MKSLTCGAWSAEEPCFCSITCTLSDCPVRHLCSSCSIELWSARLTASESSFPVARNPSRIVDCTTISAASSAPMQPSVSCARIPGVANPSYWPAVLLAKTAVAPFDHVKILFQASNPEYCKYTGALARHINGRAGLQNGCRYMRSPGTRYGASCAGAHIYNDNRGFSAL